MFQVFNINCTHLGCPVNWQAGAKLFLCPCHGGVHYSDGSVAGGPPPRRLFEREWQVSGDRLLVRQQPLPTVKQGSGCCAPSPSSRVASRAGLANASSSRTASWRCCVIPCPASSR